MNAIVNYANRHFQKGKGKIVNNNDILHSIILNVYKKNRNITKSQIIKNSFKNNYKVKSEVINAIKNLNRKMEEAAEEFFSEKCHISDFEKENDRL